MSHTENLWVTCLDNSKVYVGWKDRMARWREGERDESEEGRKEARTE